MLAPALYSITAEVAGCIGFFPAMPSTHRLALGVGIFSYSCRYSLVTGHEHHTLADIYLHVVLL